MKKRSDRSGGEFWEIYSRFDDWDFVGDRRHRFVTTPDWVSWWRTHMKCPDPICSFPRRELSEAPRPYNIELLGACSACISSVECPGELGSPVSIVREDLREVLLPFLKDAVWGECTLIDHDARKQPHFYTIQVPRVFQISASRGKRCGHRQCPTCGRIMTPDFGKQAIVRASLASREAVVDDCGSVYVSNTLADTLRNSIRFPDIKLFPIPVIPVPEDDWVLPGDHEWDGSLRRVRRDARHRS